MGLQSPIRGWILCEIETQVFKWVTLSTHTLTLSDSGEVVHSQVIYRSNGTDGTIADMQTAWTNSEQTGRIMPKSINPPNISVQVYLTICFITARGREHWTDVSSASKEEEIWV